MKNITIAIDDETHRLARIRAAELGTSISAMVKDYLNSLADGPPVATKGVRDMQTSFKHAPAEFGAPPLLQKDIPPWLVDGKWVYTRDGKPRKPGAMRHLSGGWTEEFDEWPDGFLDAVYGEDTPAADQWWRSANDVLKKPKGT